MVRRSRFDVKKVGLWEKGRPEMARQKTPLVGSGLTVSGSRIKWWNKRDSCREGSLLVLRVDTKFGFREIKNEIKVGD